MKIKFISTLGIVSLAFVFSACGNGASTTTANNSAAADAANKSNATTPNKTELTSSAPTAATPTPSSANKTSSAATPKGKTEGETVKGELQKGKTDSVILYVGEESGDYAGYCFANDSEAGRAILAACKDKEQCEVIGKIDGESGCKVPGLEADLSASGRIVKVESVKSLGRKK